MDKAIKACRDRASEPIGSRTSSETVHDDAVVEALNQGHTIKEALAIAGEKHPDEPIQWDESNIAPHKFTLNQRCPIDVLPSGTGVARLR